MEDYYELNAIGRKARDAEWRINCKRCPIGTMHKDDSFICLEVCDYVFRQGFRRGYLKRKAETDKKMKNKKLTNKITNKQE